MLPITVMDSIHPTPITWLTLSWVPLMLTTTLWGRYYFLHFTNKEIEAQITLVICPKSHHLEVGELNVNLCPSFQHLCLLCTAPTYWWSLHFPVPLGALWLSTLCPTQLQPSLLSPRVFRVLWWQSCFSYMLNASIWGWYIPSWVWLSLWEIFKRLVLCGKSGAARGSVSMYWMSEYDVHISDPPIQVQDQVQV